MNLGSLLDINALIQAPKDLHLSEGQLLFVDKDNINEPFINICSKDVESRWTEWSIQVNQSFQML